MKRAGIPTLARQADGILVASQDGVGPFAYPRALYLLCHDGTEMLCDPREVRLLATRWKNLPDGSPYFQRDQANAPITRWESDEELQARVEGELRGLATEGALFQDEAAGDVVRTVEVAVADVAVAPLPLAEPEPKAGPLDDAVIVPPAPALDEMADAAH